MNFAINFNWKWEVLTLARGALGAGEGNCISRGRTSAEPTGSGYSALVAGVGRLIGMATTVPPMMFTGISNPTTAPGPLTPLLDLVSLCQKNFPHRNCGIYSPDRFLIMDKLKRSPNGENVPKTNFQLFESKLFWQCEVSYPLPVISSMTNSSCSCCVLISQPMGESTKCFKNKFERQGAKQSKDKKIGRERTFQMTLLQRYLPYGT